MNVRRWPWPTWIVGLVLVTNAIALGGVWWNRQDPPEATLMLSGRDVDVINADPLATTDDHARALHVRLAIRYPDRSYRPPGSALTWFSREHFRANGIPVPDPMPEKIEQSAVHRTGRVRPIFAVLEVDGSAYQYELHRVCDGPEMPTPALPPELSYLPRCRYLREGPRLYVMDVGASRERLRDHYPDRSRYAILAAYLEPLPNEDQSEPAGSLQLAQTAIAIDDKWRPLLPELLRHNGDDVHLTVAIGRSLEPWLLGFSSTAVR
jgi:hypothetical protein